MGGRRLAGAPHACGHVRPGDLAPAAQPVRLGHDGHCHSSGRRELRRCICRVRPRHPSGLAAAHGPRRLLAKAPARRRCGGRDRGHPAVPRWAAEIVAVVHCHRGGAGRGRGGRTVGPRRSVSNRGRPWRQAAGSHHRAARTVAVRRRVRLGVECVHLAVWGRAGGGCRRDHAHGPGQRRDAPAAGMVCVRGGDLCDRLAPG